MAFPRVLLHFNHWSSEDKFFLSAGRTLEDRQTQLSGDSNDGLLFLHGLSDCLNYSYRPLHKLVTVLDFVFYDFKI